MSLLRQTDTAKPSMGHVLEWILRTQRHIEQFDFGPVMGAADVKEQVLTIFNARWKWMRSPLHSVGWLLNPQNFSKWHALQAGARDDERKKRLLGKILKDRDEVFKAMLGRDELVLKAQMELGQYFARADLRASAGSMLEWEPWMWWSTNGGHMPTLQTVATRVLAQPSSASASENNWSTHEFIISRRRNKLSVQRAEDLVFVFSNLKLVMHMNTAEYKDLRQGMDLEAADEDMPMAADGDVTEPEESEEYVEGSCDEDVDMLSSQEPSDVEAESEMESSGQSASGADEEDSADRIGYRDAEEFHATADFEEELKNSYMSSPEAVKKPGRPKKSGDKQPKTKRQAGSAAKAG
eukprot:347361-Chlamydomonas_euryale.AAC.1